MRFSILLILTTILVTISCSKQQAQDSLYLTSEALSISYQIDDLQAELGEYVENQEALGGVDNLQREIRLAVNGDINLDRWFKYKTTAVALYWDLKGEATDRIDELTPGQLERLKILDRNLQAYNRRFNQITKEPDNQSSLEFARVITDILTIGLEVAKMHKEL